MGKALRDFLISSQLLMVLRRSDDCQVDRPAFGRFANLRDVYSIGFAVELLQVIDVLRIVDQNVVVAGVEAKLLLRRCDLALSLKSGCRHQKDQQQMIGGAKPVRHHKQWMLIQKEKGTGRKLQRLTASAGPWPGVRPRPSPGIWPNQRSDGLPDYRW